jgi:CRP-like cAMP-binding protein
VSNKIATAKKSDFNPRTFLSTIGKGREMVSFGKKSTIFAQGDETDGLFFIQEGKVQLSVVSEAGKEATLGILSEGDFFGEGGLGGQFTRMSSAIALTDCVLLHLQTKAKTHAISTEPKLSAMFMRLLVKRNIRYQDDLVDQLFNSSEKRLARVLLRKLGIIHYHVGDNLHVRSSLLNVVLQDEDGESSALAARNLTAPTKKVSEPPPEHGRLLDRDRAKRPEPKGAVNRALFSMLLQG